MFNDSELSKYSFNIFYNVTMKVTNKYDNPWRKSCKKRGTGIDAKKMKRRSVHFTESNYARR